MGGVDEFVEQIGKHIDATVDNAVFLLDRLQARAEAAEAEVADLRQRLVEHDSKASSARQQWNAERTDLHNQLLAFTKLEAAHRGEEARRLEQTRQQLAAHDAEANAACLDWDAKCRELEQRLVTAEALIPEAAPLEWAASVVEGDLLNWPDWIERKRAETTINVLRGWATAIRIRDWRRGQGREGEEESND